MRANLVIGLCERFHCLPSAVLAEDTSLLRLLDIQRLGNPPPPDPPPPDPDGWHGA